MEDLKVELEAKKAKLRGLIEARSKANCSTRHSSAADVQRETEIEELEEEIQISGKDLSEKLHDKYPELKVLYISGYTDNSIVHNGVLEERVAFLQKPFSVQNLTQKVREVLDG